jgi:hypothetical protein
VSMAKWARFCISNRQEMPGSSEHGRELRGLCIPRSLPRWHDPDPLGGLSPAYLPGFLKAWRGGARAVLARATYAKRSRRRLTALRAQAQ